MFNRNEKTCYNMFINSYILLSPSNKRIGISVINYYIRYNAICYLSMNASKLSLI